jgi:uncharacterized protein YxeA
MKNTLIVVLTIAVVIIGYLFIKEKTKPTDYSNVWSETEPATVKPTNNYSVQNNSATNTNTNSLSGNNQTIGGNSKTVYDIELSTPNDLQVLSADNRGVKTISILAKDKTGFMSINRYSDTDSFNKVVTQFDDPAKGWKKQAENYSIGGEKATYYKSEIGETGKGYYITGFLIPSKLVSINVLHMSVIPVSEEVITQVFSSIKFNF